MKINIYNLCGTGQAIIAATKAFSDRYKYTSGICNSQSLLCELCHWYDNSRKDHGAICTYDAKEQELIYSKNDFKFLMQHRKTEHGRYQNWLSMLIIYADIKSDLDWWTELTEFKPVISDSNSDGERTVMLTYRQLIDIYKRYQTSEDVEWKAFCDWIRNLPYHELITEV